MKRTLPMMLTAMAVICLSVSSVPAQDTTTQNRLQEARRAGAGKLDNKTRGANVRVSQLLGQNIKNSQDESVGEIKDLVLDARTGKVRYAAVTYGGFLGLGNKLFAVPIEAFKIKVDPDDLGDRNLDADDYIMVLDVTKQQLEGETGFDEDHWPDMADKQWSADLDKRYGVERKTRVKDAANRTNPDQ